MTSIILPYHLRSSCHHSQAIFNGAKQLPKIYEEPTGDYAYDYALEHGITHETIFLFDIGYSPNDWRQLLHHLLALGFTEDEAVEAGVAIRNEKGRVYDRFRNR